MQSTYMLAPLRLARVPNIHLPKNDSKRQRIATKQTPTRTERRPQPIDRRVLASTVPLQEQESPVPRHPRVVLGAEKLDHKLPGPPDGPLFVLVDRIDRRGHVSRVNDQSRPPAETYEDIDRQGGRGTTGTLPKYW